MTDDQRARWNAMVVQITALEKQVAEARAAARFALDHVAELRSAWRRGAIDECDGRYGERSNRNVEVETKLRACLGDDVP